MGSSLGGAGHVGSLSFILMLKRTLLKPEPLPSVFLVWECIENTEMSQDRSVLEIHAGL